MTHPTDDSLKPCPFCGGAASLHPRTCDKNTPYNPADRAFPIARCGQCGAEAVGKDWGRPETAAEKWNTRALLAEQARTEPDLAPGVMRCARCKFRLHRINLNVNVGTVTAGDNKTEPCPNGCGPLWPVTWKQEAEEAMTVAEGLCDRAVAAERELADLRERLGPRAAPPLKAEQAKDAAEDAAKLKGVLGVATELLCECIGPLEASAAILEDEDGNENIEALIGKLKEFDAAIAALQAEPQGWRPIETAPKNADVILSDGVNVSEGGWLSDIDAGADYEGQLGMAGWWAVAWPDEHGVKPTHWMPLPTPPKD